MKNQKAPLLSARVTQRDADLVSQLARRLDLNRSEVIRRCVRLGCEKLRNATLPGASFHKESRQKGEVDSF